ATAPITEKENDMTKRWIRTALLLMPSMALIAAEPRMTPEERTKALQWFEQSRKEFLAAIDGVTERQWTWKPAADRWSIAEVAEHVVLAEASQYAAAKKSVAGSPNPDWEEQTRGKTAILEAVLAGRLGKVQAPEAIVPKEGITRAQALERFEKQRKETV